MGQWDSPLGDVTPWGEDTRPVTRTKPPMWGHHRWLEALPSPPKDQSLHQKYNLSIQFNLSKTVVNKDKLAFTFEYKDKFLETYQSQLVSLPY